MWNQLELEKCPYCSRHKPTFTFRESAYESRPHDGSTDECFRWRAYACAACGKVVIAAWKARRLTNAPSYIAPDFYHPNSAAEISDSIPEKARALLRQTQDTLHAPAAAVMVAASSVDEMLKQKGLKDGSLYARINLAAEQHLITEEMKKWAHQVRLDANDQRHADEAASLPESEEAKRSFDFALALAEFLFVLPARVTRGVQSSAPQAAPPAKP